MWQKEPVMVSNLSEAIVTAEAESEVLNVGKAFVIGGARVYAEAMPSQMSFFLRAFMLTSQEILF